MCYIHVYLQSCGQIDRAKQNRTESFTADFLRDFAESVISCLLGGRLDTCCQIQAFQRFSCDFLNSQVFSRLVRQYSLIHFLVIKSSSVALVVKKNCAEM